MMMSHTHHQSRQSGSAPQHGRTRFIVLLLYLFFLGIIGRLAYWQIVHRSDLQAEAEQQYTKTIKVPAHRGKIYTDDGSLLVGNQTVYRVVAQPPLLRKTPDQIANELAPLLLPNDQRSLSDIKTDVTSKISAPNVKWVVLKNRIDEETKKNIESLSEAGIAFESYEVRSYPEASMAAQVTGFVGKDKDGNDQGYFGIEGELDRELRGYADQQTFEKDGLGLHSLFNQQVDDNHVDGRDVVLSLRRDIQYVVEDLLQKGMQKYESAAGEVVIMNPKTGKILAMASFPNYRQDQYQLFDPQLYKNPSVTSTYEPGSIFKVLTIASGEDAGMINAMTQCTKCAGPREIAEYKIKTWNDKYTPDITMQDALAKSDNTAMIFVSDLLGGNRFVNYIKNFGIGEATHVELQEDTGTPLRKDWKPIDLATSSFGQGIATTSLQMVRAVGAIANHGIMMRPSIIDKVVDPGSKTEIPVPPVEERQVISAQAAEATTQMMVYAADHGEAHWASSKTHLAATKTGTAQVPIAGHYDDKKTMASFIGFAPPNDPQFVMIVKLQSPQSSPWAAETAAPLWYEIADKLYLLLNIPPDR